MTRRRCVLRHPHVVFCPSITCLDAEKSKCFGTSRLKLAAAPAPTNFVTQFPLATLTLLLCLHKWLPMGTVVATSLYSASLRLKKAIHSFAQKTDVLKPFVSVTPQNWQYSHISVIPAFNCPVSVSTVHSQSWNHPPGKSVRRGGSWHQGCA